MNKSLLLVGLILSNSVWAYGGGGSSSTKACPKPKFSEFTPAEHAEVAAGSAFSFIASANTYPQSIKVSVKSLPVDVKVEDKHGTGFKVSGKLPDALKDVHARISIDADSTSKCNGNGGWLVKIKP